MENLTLLLTSDGSHTLYRADMDETYHSIHGAVEESYHVYIRHGLERFENKGRIGVLEMGFGTGLNLALTLIWHNQHPHTEIFYETIEAFPLSEEVLAALNLFDLPELEAVKQEVYNAHAAVPGVPVQLRHNFYFTVHHHSVEAEIAFAPADVVYYDAFAPSKQPRMWTEDVLKKFTSALLPGGVLVTYCASGAFKRLMKFLGLTVEILPGPHIKKEMVRAHKPGEPLPVHQA